MSLTLVVLRTKDLHWNVHSVALMSLHSLNFMRLFDCVCQSLDWMQLRICFVFLLCRRFLAWQRCLNHSVRFMPTNLLLMLKYLHSTISHCIVQITLEFLILMWHILVRDYAVIISTEYFSVMFLLSGLAVCVLSASFLSAIFAWFLRKFHNSVDALQLYDNLVLSANAEHC